MFWMCKIFVKPSKHTNSKVSRSAVIDQCAEISKSEINDFCRVEKGVNVINSVLAKYVKIGWDSYVYNSFIDSFSYTSIRISISNSTIGKYCSIGQDTLIAGGIHPTNFISTNPVFFQKHNPQRYTFTESSNFVNFKKTVIGNDVWIGAGCIIHDGVEIGNGAIIGAGSVVTKNVEPYAIYAGIPSRFIRYRFDRDIINLLEELRWWDYDIEVLKKVGHSFNNPITSKDEIISFFEKLRKMNQ
jgi:acetyltransferase-like isoleucine patch superfamily enzyme